MTLLTITVVALAFSRCPPVKCLPRAVVAAKAVAATHLDVCRSEHGGGADPSPEIAKVVEHDKPWYERASRTQA